VDEEILQDFLVEADELLGQLDEQLIALEASPDDSELLNAIFRGFHTIKGGAGFLEVNALVSVCHLAENLFDRIRNQQLAYDANVADAILKAFDVIRDMIGALQQGERTLADAPAQVLADLDALYRGQAVSVEAETAEIVTPQAMPTPELTLPDDVDPDGEITDEEFEALLAQRDAISQTASSEVTPVDAAHDQSSEPSLVLPDGVDPDGEITDEEFEALLAQRDAQQVSKPQAAPSAATTLKSQEESESTHQQSELQAEPLSTPAPSSQIKEGARKPSPASAPAESSVRVDTKRLDEIMNLVGELVLVRNRLLTIKGSDLSVEALTNAVSNLDHVTTDLQNAVMKTRMQPVKKVFGRFPRVVRDLARKLGKHIDLELRGEETDLDKNLVEALSDPLVHLVRNSVDHGIELPQERVKKGKDKTGKIILAAEQEGDHILLSILDDGKGMDADLLRRKAVEKGLMDDLAAQQLDDRQAFMLIMAAGFSTAEQVSDISGRGVGMDVVKSMITKLNGSIDIDSVYGEGTRILIRVPLTLAILPTLMVSFGQDSYAIPLTGVQEIFDYQADKVNYIDGRKMVRLRDKSIPLLFLSDWLQPELAIEDFKGYKVVIVAFGSQRVGMVVEHVNGQEEVVIKPLGIKLANVRGYAGATITGNGSIALILDIPGVVERFQ
jgi:two-component system chemotaxis sensor kinase CheA